MSSLIRTLSFLLVAAAAAHPEITTQPADRFVDSIGVCTHWTYPDTPYGIGKAISRLRRDLRVRRRGNEEE